MTPLLQKITTLFRTTHTSGWLSVIHALALETLVVGYMIFISLFTIETLLPTFITVRFSLTKFFFLLIAATMLTSLLSHLLSVSFRISWNLKNPLLWLGLLWGIGILIISLIKFPVVLILILTTLFLAVGYLFWRIFLEEN